MRLMIAVVGFLLLAPALRATVLVPAEFGEIVSGSQIIVYGRVADVHAEWSDDRRRIDTIVTLEAATYLKGGPGEAVTFRVPGGQIRARAAAPLKRSSRSREPGAATLWDRLRSCAS